MDTHFISKVHTLMAQYRTQCLWYFDVDFYPQTPLQVLKVLESIESHADAAGYTKARTLKQWLLQNSNLTSAV